MAKVTITLPDELGEYMEAEIAARGLPDASAFFQPLLEDDQDREALDELEQLLIEGIDSGPPEPITEEFWEERRRELARRIDKTAVA